MAASIEHYQLPLPPSEGARLLIVVAPYYRQIADGLVEGALKQQRLLAAAPREVHPDDLAGIFTRSLENW